MPNVDRSSSVPLYEQIKLILRDQILKGEFSPGELLPTERELCDTYNVSRITVVRALNELALAGFITRTQGKGSAVNSGRIENDLNSITGFARSMQAQGFKVTSQVLSFDHIPADENLNAIFKHPTGDSSGYTRVRRLRLLDDTPAVIFNTVVTRHIGVALQDYDLNDVSFYDLYRRITGMSVARSEVTLVPVTATPEIVDYFAVQPNTAHFWHRSISYLENNTPIETTTAIYRGDIFQFKSTLFTAAQDVRPKDPWFINDEALVGGR